METTERLIKILKEHEWDTLNKTHPEIGRNTDLKIDLSMDSFDRAEYTFYVEQELGISIPDEKAEEFTTLGDYADYVDKQRKVS